MEEVVFPGAGRRLRIRLSLHMTSGIDLLQPRLYLALRKILPLRHLLLDITGHMAKWAIQFLLEGLVLRFHLLSDIIHLFQVVLGRQVCLIGRLTHHRPIIAVNHLIH